MVQENLILDTLRSKGNCCHFAEKISKCIFLNENIKILFKVLKVFWICYSEDLKHLGNQTLSLFFITI